MKFDMTLTRLIVCDKIISIVNSFTLSQAIPCVACRWKCFSISYVHGSKLLMLNCKTQDVGYLVQYQTYRPTFIPGLYSNKHSCSYKKDFVNYTRPSFTHYDQGPINKVIVTNHESGVILCSPVLTVLGSSILPGCL